MVTTAAAKKVDARTTQALKLSYANLVKAGQDSVRAAWRFGQTLDSFTDAYSQIQLAEAMGLSVSTVYTYRRFFGAYQTPELAVQASEDMETYDIRVLTALHDQLLPVQHGRPLAGRHWRYTCKQCASHDVRREEIDADGNPVIEDPAPDEGAPPAQEPMTAEQEELFRDLTGDRA